MFGLTHNRTRPYFPLAAIFLAVFLFCGYAQAHPGRTAADGCHYCRTNCDSWGVAWNQRHCHGGSSASSPAPAASDTTPTPVSAPEPKTSPAIIYCSNKESCYSKVKSVTDGDTITLDTGEKVRYIGIDTPETVHPSKPVQCFGKEASNENKELVEGKEIRLEKDVSDKDKYGRLLRYIYVGDTFVNDYLVRNGFAYSSSYPPDVKNQNKFLEGQREARENKRGFWADGTCDETSSTLTEKEITEKINSAKQDYQNNPDGFRENLINDIVSLVGSGVDINNIGYFVYTILPDINN